MHDIAWYFSANICLSPSNNESLHNDHSCEIAYVVLLHTVQPQVGGCSVLRVDLAD